MPGAFALSSQAFSICFMRSSLTSERVPHRPFPPMHFPPGELPNSFFALRALEFCPKKRATGYMVHSSSGARGDCSHCSPSHPYLSIQCWMADEPLQVNFVVEEISKFNAGWPISYCKSTSSLRRVPAVCLILYIEY